MTASAFDRSPALHRFPRVQATWVTRAAQRVVHDHAARADLIWKNGSSAGLVAGTLRMFDGVGQKKAAMAIDLLARRGALSSLSLEDTDVAYDVHVRRVFLRTGLADRDDPLVIGEVARRLAPLHPGGLDLPTWHVGRSWCRADHPFCDACPLAFTCIRAFAASESVRSV